MGKVRNYSVKARQTRKRVQSYRKRRKIGVQYENEIQFANFTNSDRNINNEETSKNHLTFKKI